MISKEVEFYLDSKRLYKFKAGEPFILCEPEHGLDDLQLHSVQKRLAAVDQPRVRWVRREFVNSMLNLRIKLNSLSAFGKRFDQ